MPIFMDRHNVSETVTAEHVAQLHQEDLKIQDQFGCRGMTYWFDDKRKTAFCLIEAPDIAAIEKMHNKAHGQVPHSVIEVDTKIVESFLGRIEDPEKEKNIVLNIINEPAFRVIMITVINYASPPGSDTEPFISGLNDFNKTISKIITDYDGVMVKQSNNRCLVSFRSASYALHAAIDIQLRFKDFKNENNYRNIVVKTSLSAGVPVTDKKHFFEDAVKLADRMCRAIDKEIITSSEVKELYDNENPATLKKRNDIFILTHEDEIFLTRLMDYTETAWYNSNLKAGDFIKPLGCSKSQLYRKMTLLTNKSPNSFIKEYRLNEAIALLTKKKGNISEIAFETGFSSPSYFSKCFQKRYGHLPSDYIPA